MTGEMATRQARNWNVIGTIAKAQATASALAELLGGTGLDGRTIQDPQQAALMEELGVLLCRAINLLPRYARSPEQEQERSETL